jgi:hypothetical protein
MNPLHQYIYVYIENKLLPFTTGCFVPLEQSTQHLFGRNLCASSADFVRLARQFGHERCRFSRGPTTRSSSMLSGQRRARMRSVPTRPCAEAHASAKSGSLSHSSSTCTALLMRASRAVQVENELKNMWLNPNPKR